MFLNLNWIAETGTVFVINTATSTVESTVSVSVTGAPEPIAGGGGRCGDDNGGDGLCGRGGLGVVGS
eukprot:13337996-Ditylum_brightwellii.AAC.1